MTHRISSKEILAKLMATENILVEHSNIPTAAFDLVNRKLLLPNWKDISDDVYTLLISHEVGHALFTPTEEWESQIMANKDYALKQVVNIVEDVRIEKLIQQKYPGTVRAFRSGYSELEKTNLFGTQGRDISSYNLIDRLNIHFKVGHFGYAKVPFQESELHWLDKISSCKTFADVVTVATELKKFVDENPESQGEEQKQESEQSNVDDSNSNNTQETPSQGSSEGNVDQQRASSSSGSEEQNKEQSQSQSQQSSSEKNADDVEQKRPSEQSISETQKHFDQAITELVDSSTQDIKYVNMPNILLDRLIVPYKKVHEQISTYYSTYYAHIYSDIESKIQQFKSGSKNVVNQLANIFEIKKRARLDVRALVSSTGKLDTNKLYSYRYNEDIFKKLTVVPQGKSHGLVMFIDMSSSMHDNISSTFEQLLNLVLFCRRVSIPFEVYGFTDSGASRGDLISHPENKNELCFDSRFCLRQYFSSKMSGVEFNKALGNIICVMNHYSGKLYAGLPAQEHLNTTPLVPTILAATEIVKRFRKENSLDIVNTIFLTDGEDTHGLLYSDGDPSGPKTLTNSLYGRSRFNNYNKYLSRHYIRDNKTKNQWLIQNATSDMFNILRETTGVKVIGFHLTRKREAQNLIGHYSKDGSDYDKQLDSFKNQKFCEITKVPGYDAYYLIPSGNSLNVADDEFQSNVDTTLDWDDEKQAKKALKAIQKDFNNFMKQKVVSRVLLNRFIEHIS